MFRHSPLQKIEHPLFEKFQLNIQIKRDDLIDPIISGNKWRKLKYNLKHVKDKGYQGIVSFGGAYSNHIHALAYACKAQNLKSIGVIRGEENYQDNFTLSQARKWGMQLHFVNRKTYREKNNSELLNRLNKQYPNFFIVPEGGSNALAIPGVAEICQELKSQTEYDTLITPVGSAGTISGLIQGDNGEHNILGIAVLKQQDYLENEISGLLSTNDNAKNVQNWKILNEFHQGGYAKFSQSNLAQLKSFQQAVNIPFEPVYSGKMILALLALIQDNYFPKGHRIVLLHTGGLQGLGGLIEQKKITADEWPLPLALRAC